MRKLFIIIVLLFPLTGTAEISNYEKCKKTNELASLGVLSALDKTQLKKGMCFSTYGIASGISSGQKLLERACTAAAEVLVIEYQRRYGKTSSKEMLSEC